MRTPVRRTLPARLAAPLVAVLAAVLLTAPPAGAATGGRMLVPMTGVVTQRAFDPGCGSSSHEGYDIAAPVGTKVYAAAAGTAYVRSDPNGFGPNYLFVQHAAGWDTVYGHTSRALVASGSHVRKGQLIALSGNLGFSTGPHLHFQVDRDQPYTGVDLGAPAFPCRATVHQGAVVPRWFAGLG